MTYNFWKKRFHEYFMGNFRAIFYKSSWHDFWMDWNFKTNFYDLFFENSLDIWTWKPEIIKVGTCNLKSWNVQIENFDKQKLFFAKSKSEMTIWELIVSRKFFLAFFLNFIRNFFSRNEFFSNFFCEILLFIGQVFFFSSH